MKQVFNFAFLLHESIGPDYSRGRLKLSIFLYFRPIKIHSLKVLHFDKLVELTKSWRARNLEIASA